jgi:HPt (histidine-containing phosphotransfer) domain-containing protein
MLLKMQHVPKSRAMPESGSIQARQTDPPLEKQPVSNTRPGLIEPPRVNGLDLEVGLRRAMGVNTLYLSMLKGFVETRRATSEEIRSALELLDLKKAELLSHSLRGIAAQIGATLVPQDAQRLEEAIVAASPNETLVKCLRTLDASLRELIDGLEYYLSQMSQ